MSKSGAAAKKSLPVRTVQEVALRAIDLNALIKAAVAELETLKEFLRKDSERTPWKELLTAEGSVRAAFVEPAMGPKKDKDRLVSLSPVLEALAPDHFALLFSQSTVVDLEVKDTVTFAERLKLLTLAEQSVVRSLVEEKPGQIRITLPAKK